MEAGSAQTQSRSGLRSAPCESPGLLCWSVVGSLTSQVGKGRNSLKLQVLSRMKSFRLVWGWCWELPSPGPLPGPPARAPCPGCGFRGSTASLGFSFLPEKGEEWEDASQVSSSSHTLELYGSRGGGKKNSYHLFIIIARGRYCQKCLVFGSGNCFLKCTDTPNSYRVR